MLAGYAGMIVFTIVNGEAINKKQISFIVKYAKKVGKI